MPDSYTIERTDIPDGELVAFGPFDTQFQAQLKIPRTMARVVKYKDFPLDALVELVFTGEKIEIVRLTLSGRDGYVATGNLVKLALPAIIREIAEQAIPNADYWSLKSSTSKPSGPDAEAYMAQLYWFEYATWGSPRGAIMEYGDWSRTNANWRIRKIAGSETLPGAHSGDKAKFKPKSSSESAPVDY